MQNVECSPVKWRADFTGQGVQNENSRLNGSHSPFCILPSSFCIHPIEPRGNQQPNGLEHERDRHPRRPGVDLLTR